MPFTKLLIKGTWIPPFILLFSYWFTERCWHFIQLTEGHPSMLIIVVPAFSDLSTDFRERVMMNGAR